MLLKDIIITHVWWRYGIHCTFNDCYLSCAPQRRLIEDLFVYEKPVHSYHIWHGRFEDNKCQIIQKLGYKFLSRRIKNFLPSTFLPHNYDMIAIAMCILSACVILYVVTMTSFILKARVMHVYSYQWIAVINNIVLFT